jgi:AcrR family transcriptional regulator
MGVKEETAEDDSVGYSNADPESDAKPGREARGLLNPSISFHWRPPTESKSSINFTYCQSKLKWVRSISVESRENPSCKRSYQLGKRLEQMDRTKAEILIAGRDQLESGGVRDFSMESLAKASGVTRQTIHNLFGTRAGVLEALFDQIAIASGMERMREVMTAGSAEAMMDGFIGVFSNFWAKNRLLLRRIHGIAAIDPEFGKAVQARNQRRHMAAARVLERLEGAARAEGREERVASLVALTSFEFFDALGESLGSTESARKHLPVLIRRALNIDSGDA